MNENVNDHRAENHVHNFEDPDFSKDLGAAQITEIAARWIFTISMVSRIHLQ